jgi:glycosyltransferase involved in cell wall biosynthesis
MERIKVLYYIDSLGRGGAETQAVDVCRNAARFGIDVTFVSARGGPLESEVIASGVEYVKLDRRLPLDLYLASQIRKIIKERGIQIVHGYQAVEGVHLYMATRGLKDVKRVLSFQGFVADRKNRLSLKYLIPRMHANLSVSEGLRKWLSEKDRLDTTTNFSVLFNGADPERLKASGRSLRDELGFAEDALVFGMVANFYIDPRKDQLTICRALPTVFERLPNAQFIFAGGIEPGAEDKMADCLNICIENGIADRVHFLGSRSDVPDVLTALDVFVFSSLQEGLPVAVTEAMLAGVPLIVSDIDPLLEATANGEYGKVFPVGDHTKLAELMIELGSSDNERRELGARAKEFADENFSIDAHMQRLVQIYSRLLKK